MSQLLTGVFTTTYYLINTRDARYAGLAPAVPLADAASGAVLATVPRLFAADLALEGSGRLAARGIVVAYDAGPTDGSGPLRVRVKPASKPWGSSASGDPAVPLRTLAVDRAIVPLGSRVYLADLDGWRVPLVEGIGGWVHDGWFVADDTGGAIRGLHFDVYVGPRAMRDPLRARMPSERLIDAQVDDATAGQPSPYRPPPAPPGGGGGGGDGGSGAGTLLAALGTGAAAWLAWPWVEKRLRGR